MATRVEWDRSAMHRLLESEQGPVGDLVWEIAEDVEAVAKGMAPYRTGFLRGSIYSDVESGREGPVAVVGATAEYALYVEYGTRFMAAQPYLRPALQQVVG